MCGCQTLTEADNETRRCYEKERERNALSRGFFIETLRRCCIIKAVVAAVSVGSNEAKSGSREASTWRCTPDGVMFAFDWTIHANSIISTWSEPMSGAHALCEVVRTTQKDLPSH
jgi:hypothetical protein